MLVNGKPFNLESIPNSKNLQGLLTHLGLNVNTVAVEKNGEIWEREKWETTELLESDSIEIIKFVGGG